MNGARRWALWLVCVVGFAAGAPNAFAGPRAIAWKQDLAQGFATAAKQHKLVMAEFFAPW